MLKVIISFDKLKKIVQITNRNEYKTFKFLWAKNLRVNEQKKNERNMKKIICCLFNDDISV